MLLAAIQMFFFGWDFEPKVCITFARIETFFPYSGRFSRKPLILASLAGYLLLNVIYMVNAFWFYQLKVAGCGVSEKLAILKILLRWSFCCLNASKT